MKKESSKFKNNKISRIVNSFTERKKEESSRLIREKFGDVLRELSRE